MAWRAEYERRKREVKRLLEQERVIAEVVLKEFSRRAEEHMREIAIREEIVRALEGELRRVEDEYAKTPRWRIFRKASLWLERRRLRSELAAVRAEAAVQISILHALVGRFKRAHREALERLREIRGRIAELKPKRVHKAHMWYGWVAKRDTPDPLAMVSVYVYTFHPDRYPNARLDDYLWLVATSKEGMWSLGAALEAGMAGFRVEGREARPVDFDEFEREGLEMERPYWYCLIYSQGAGRTKVRREYWGEIVDRRVVRHETLRPGLWARERWLRGRIVIAPPRFGVRLLDVERPIEEIAVMREEEWEALLREELSYEEFLRRRGFSERRIEEFFGRSGSGSQRQLEEFLESSSPD